jgi:hypothetical protein
MGLWYISFADDGGFRGATVVEAKDAKSALAEATRRGINPGGEAKMLPAPDIAEAKAMLNRLVLEDEMRALGHVKAKELAPDVADAFDAAAEHVCQDCNS